MSDRPFDQHAPGSPAGPTDPMAKPQGTTSPSSGIPATTPPAGGRAGQQSTKEAAKQEAASVGQDAKEGAGQVAQTAKQEVQQVAQEAKGQAQSLLSEVRNDVTGQARDQQHRAAQGLHGLAEEFKQMASSTEGSSMAVGLVQQAADRFDGVAGWLEGREPADLLHEVKRYARRHPGTFLAVCGLAGLVGGRLTRSLRDEASGDSGGDYGYGAYGGARGPAYGQTTYQPAADTGVYATTPGVPTAYATRGGYPTDLDTAEEPLPTGEELLTREDGDRR